MAPSGKMIGTMKLKDQNQAFKYLHLRAYDTTGVLHLYAYLNAWSDAKGVLDLIIQPDDTIHG